MSDVYEWRSTGNDPLCDAMAGYHYGAEPSRPHPNCNCSIEKISGQNLSATLKLWHEGNEYKKNGPGDYDYELILTFGYTVQCPNNTSVQDSGTVEVTRDYSLMDDADLDEMDALISDIFMEAYHEVVALEESLDCPGPEIV